MVWSNHHTSGYMFGLLKHVENKLSADWLSMLCFLKTLEKSSTITWTHPEFYSNPMNRGRTVGRSVFTYWNAAGSAMMEQVCDRCVMFSLNRNKLAAVIVLVFVKPEAPGVLPTALILPQWPASSCWAQKSSNPEPSLAALSSPCCFSTHINVGTWGFVYPLIIPLLMRVAWPDLILVMLIKGPWSASKS